MTAQELEVERKEIQALLATDAGERLVRHLRRRYSAGPPQETESQMLNRLGRLDALADIERLREEAKGR